MPPQSSSHKSATSPPARLTADMNDADLYDAVTGIYQNDLAGAVKAREWLAKRGILDEDALKTFRIGYAGRVLSSHMPSPNSVAGKAVRARLVEIGINRDSDKPRFAGTITFPITDVDGKSLALYGRRFSPGLPATCEKEPWAGRTDVLWNIEGVSCAPDGVIVVCNNVVDALACWIHGVKSVTWIRDDEHLLSVAPLLREHAVKTLLCPAHEPAVAVEGITLRSLHVPYGYGLWYWLLREDYPKNSLRELLEACRPPEPPPEPPPAPAENEEKSGDEGEADETPQSTDDIRKDFGDRSYRIRGLNRNTTWDSLKVNIRVAVGNRFHLDHVDLYSARDRIRFIRDASIETLTDEDLIKSDLGRLLMYLENLQERRLTESEEKKDKTVELTEEEREEALAFLKDPDLLHRIVADIKACGLVGEDDNALLGYIAAVSRKLDDPLSVIIQSSSSAGKSSLMEAILELIPPEDRVQLTSMTSQSLFYMEPGSLKHRTVAISESEGMERAGYALKLLQSEKRLSIATTSRDSKSGRQVTQTYEVEGPIQTIITSTAPEIDEELQNRSIVLTVSEDREQTRAIHERQRRSQTLEGILCDSRLTDGIIARHRNAQRLLEPVIVINPHAESLEFDSRRLRSRRDHMKYLNLIRAVTLLHQHQRERQTLEHDGKALTYIEVSDDDIAVADRMMVNVLENSVHDLAPQTRKLLASITDLIVSVAEGKGMDVSEVSVSRRQVREHVGTRNATLGKRLRQLVDHEYLFVTRGLHGRMSYRLPWQLQTAELRGIMQKFPE